MRKTKEDTELSKLRILDAAQEHFCKQGFIGSNMNDIAKDIGMTKGAIFWHFETKAGLLRAVMQRAVCRLKQIFDESFSMQIPVIEKCRKVLLRLSKDQAFEVLMVLGDAKSDGGVPKKLLEDTYHDISDIITGSYINMIEAKERGELFPETDIMNILISVVLFMSGFSRMEELKPIFGSNHLAIDMEAVINLVFRGLLSCQKTQ
jgi:AcrR family transcriptional regulator